jgi:hypothetical protein
MLMKRVWVHVVAGLSLLTGAGVALIAFSACVHNDSTIFVRDALASQYVSNGSVCMWTSDPAQTYHSSGVLDVALRQQYDGVFLVGNQMVAQANSSQLQTETSTFTIQGAVVRITNAKGVERRAFTTTTSASISPASGNTPGYAAVIVPIVDPETIQSAPETVNILNALLGQSGFARLITYVRFFGHSLGGQSLESNEFEFPVDVCNGCLINYSNNPNYPIPNCVGNASVTSTSQAQIPCFPGQDLNIDCSACQGNTAGCRGAYQVLPGLDAGSG